MNPKEADDRPLSREVLARIPKFLDRPTVLGIGEIGLNRITRNEIDTYTEQIEIALEHRQMILIHTPHLEDKLKGTRISVDVLNSFATLERERVLVDHAEEHTLRLILDNGYWAGLTLYPNTKVSAPRAVDMIERFGPERICVAGACDWGPSDAIAVPRFIMEMRRRRHSEELIHRVVFENPVQFLEPVAEVQAARDARPRRRARLIVRHQCACPVIPGFISPTARTSIPPMDGTPSSPTSPDMRRR